MTLSSCNTDVRNLFYQRVIMMLLVMHYLWSSISVHLCSTNILLSDTMMMLEQDKEKLSKIKKHTWTSAITNKSFT